MRVIAGTLGGRVFSDPKGQRTHPMSEKMRGAVFNTLGDITDLEVLDAFAGSGALSFEAISRGAAYATAIDIDKKAVSSIITSTKDLGIENQMKVIRSGLSSWLETIQSEQFDIVLADPPYKDLQLNIIEKLLACIKPGGIFVLSWPGKEKAPGFASLELLRQKDYGDAKLVFYKQAIT